MRSYGYYNNGLSMRARSADSDMLEDEIVLDHVADEGELNAMFPGRTAALLTERRAAMLLDKLQARKALNHFGLRSQVEAFIATQGEFSEMADAWNVAPSIERLNPLILTLAPQLGLTDEQLDALFEYGATQ